MTAIFVKHSIGKLRKAPRNKPRSPHMTGRLALQRATLETLVKQLMESGKDEIDCNLAAWINRDREGHYFTIQLSPLFLPIGSEEPTITVEEFFRTLNEEGGE